MTAARVVLRVTLLAVAFGLGTAVLGWGAVAVIAAGWGLVARGARLPSLAAALAAAGAWGVGLVWSGVQGPVPLLVTRLGLVAGASGAWFVVATLLLPFVLAGSASAVVVQLARGLNEKPETAGSVGSGAVTGAPDVPHSEPGAGRG